MRNTQPAVRFKGRIWFETNEEHLDALRHMLASLATDVASWHRLLDEFVEEGEWGWQEYDGYSFAFRPANGDEIHERSWRMAESGWIGDVRRYGPPSHLREATEAALNLPQFDDLPF